MQPPSTTPTIGEARSHEQGRGYGLVLFAAILLLVIGCFNLIYGIAAVTNCTHGSDAPDTAAFEIGYFFPGLDLI